MELLQRAAGWPSRLGILPGTFNPPTVAHLALARAALARVEEVLFVLPRALPHKSFEEAGFEERLEMLRAALAAEPRFSIGSSRGGLFIEIARECREWYGGAALFFVCGRDAAERIVNWDYGQPGAFSPMLEEFELLVAGRAGEYYAPGEFGGRIHRLEMPRLDRISATEVRRRIAAGEPWEDLVPAAVVPLARAIYRR